MLQRKIYRVANERNGFILLDVILGIAILSVALVSIAFAWRQSTVTTISARNYNQATYYAQQALEQLKANDGNASATWATNTSVAASGSMPAFTITTTVLATGDAPAYDGLSQGVRDKLVPVRATVTWQETSGGGNANRSVVIVSYYLK